MTKDPHDMTPNEVLRWLRSTNMTIYISHHWPQDPIAFWKLKASHCGKDGKYRTRHACKPTRMTKL